MPGGMLDALLAGGFAAGGKTMGLGLIAYAAYKLIAFLLTFIAARLDARQATIDRQQERLDVSLGNRLDHLERIEKANRQEMAANRDEITRLRECVEVLAGELRRKDPNNPKLVEISRTLAAVWTLPPPGDTPDDMKDLLGRAE